MRLRFFVAGLVAVSSAAFLTAPAISQPAKAQSEPKPLVAPFSEADANKARTEWAKFLKIPETKSLDLGKGVKLDMVLIPPGVFKMGTPKAVRDDEALRMADQVHHYVRLTHPFYMALTETNQEQFAAVMGANPSWFSKGGGGAGKVKGKDTSKYPVEQVSWYDALMFCQKTKVQGLRIPTEAEWEYACRAGTQTNFALGQAITVKEANFNDELHRTARVASYRENNFGLFDMHGNVLEWCLDGYLIQYEKLPAIDPFQLEARGRRIARGGSWYGNAEDCRSATRFNFWDDLHYNDVGFRVVLLP